jgi:hypothetical protein
MSDIFNYSLEEITDPQGKNGLSAFAAYYQRLLYKEEVYPNVNYAPLDVWYNKVYYGKIDNNNNSVVPRIPRLKAFDNNIFALGFVIDQAREFVEKMQAALQTGVCLDQSGNPKIWDPKFVRGYENPLEKYNDSLSGLYEAFADDVPRNTDTIKTSADFAHLFAQFLVKAARFVPVTFTNYVLGTQVGVFDTGLSLALDNPDFGDDNLKYESWLSDPNYNFYVSLAKDVGFVVNKNFPWVLTADLFGKQVRANLENVTNESGDPLTKDNFFDYYYNRTYLQDIRLLKTFINNAYNTFVSIRPFYEEKRYSDRCGKFQVDVFDRPEVFNQDVLSDKFMLDLYLQLRHIEVEEPVAITTKTKNDLYSIYSLQPNKQISKLNNGANQINLTYRDYLYSDKYALLIDESKKDLDSEDRSATLQTVGSIVQQLY